MTRVDLTGAAVLEKGCVYIVPLIEELNLPKDIWARANPKSTTGRLDIFTRLITDHGIEFEYVPQGYKGRLYAEIVSRTFTVHVRAGMRLSQLRFVRGNPRPSDAAMSVLNQDEPLVYWDEDSPAKAQINRGLLISVNLQAHEASEAIAYKAKKNAPSVDVGKINHYSPEEFWDVKHQTGNKGLILDPGDFYILASKERISVPPQWAAEMGSIDPSIGEFRIHYAGFFDPGFGYGSGDVKGTRAVLHVRAHDVPFLIEHVHHWCFGLDLFLVIEIFSVRLLRRCGFLGRCAGPLAPFGHATSRAFPGFGIARRTRVHPFRAALQRRTDQLAIGEAIMLCGRARCAAWQASFWRLFFLCTRHGSGGINCVFHGLFRPKISQWSNWEAMLIKVSQQTHTSNHAFQYTGRNYW